MRTDAARLGVLGIAVVFCLASAGQPQPAPQYGGGMGAGGAGASPLPPGTGDVHLLEGAICTSTFTEISSRYKRITFDGRGHALWGNDLVVSGKTTDGFGNTTSTYGGYGSSNDGNPANHGSYSVQGDTITIQWGDGSVWSLRVNFRQASGQITEFHYGDELWGASLCN